MALTVDQFLQLILQTSKELSLPTLGAVLGILLAQWLNAANVSSLGAAGFLIGMLITQTKSWLQSRELPYLAYLCITNRKLTHTIIFERHKELAMFRQVQYCQICGNSLLKQCPHCEKVITLRGKDEEIGRFCRSCGTRLFDETVGSPLVASTSSLRRRRKHSE
jgi:hypothetical protein